VNELDRRLTDAGTRFRAIPQALPSLPDLDRRRRRGWLIPVAMTGAAAVVAAVVIPLVALGGGDTARVRAPVTNPSSSHVPESANAESYAVAPPLLRAPTGPVSLRKPPCTPADVTAKAATATASDGVLGLITIHGAGCSVAVDPATITLLDAAGQPLDVAVGPGNPTNPVQAVRPDIAQGVGSVKVGFAWTGAYCGPAAASVRLAALPGEQSELTIPLTGPAPRCAPNAGSRLVPGLVGSDSPQVAVEPAPVAWSGLTASIEPIGTVDQDALTFTVVLANRTATAIALSDPCPRYEVSASAPVPVGTMSSGTGGSLCSERLVVPAHGSIRIPITASFTGATTDRWRPGGTVHLAWAIAGVPTAETDAIIAAD